MDPTDIEFAALAFGIVVTMFLGLVYSRLFMVLSGILLVFFGLFVYGITHDGTLAFIFGGVGALTIFAGAVSPGTDIA